MSGPKGFSYQVVSAQELRRREDNARRGRCEQHVIKLAGLCGQLEHYGAAPSVTVATPKRANHDELIKWENDLVQALAATQDQVHQVAAQAIVQRLNAGKVALDVSGLTLGLPQASATTPAPSASTPTPSQAGPAAELTKIAQLVAGLTDADQREQLTIRAAQVAATSHTDQAKGALLHLKTEVTTALRAEEFRALAGEVMLGIAHLNSPEAERLRLQAKSVGTMPEVTSLKQAATALLEAEAKAQDTQYVQQALGEVLEELGFTLEEDFEVAELGRAVAVADHPDHPGYGLRFQVNPADQRIYARLVAERATSPEDDTQAELETCAKTHAVMTALGRRGVAADLQFELAPGEATVDRLERTRSTGRSRSKQRRQTASRSRTVS